MGKFIVSIGKFTCAWSIPVCDDSAWANCLSALASYLRMGKFTFAWSTDTDALAHGQIHFCAQTFFVWSIIITLNAHAKMKTLIKVAGHPK